MESTNIDIDKIINEIKKSDQNNDKLYEQIKEYYNKEQYLNLLL